MPKESLILVEWKDSKVWAQARILLKQPGFQMSVQRDNMLKEKQMVLKFNQPKCAIQLFQNEA